MAPMPPITTHILAEQHERLWLTLTALHSDLASLASRRAGLAVGETVRVTAESLLSDCAPFADGHRLPVAAADVAGLLVQLGQALAWLDAYEARHAFWNPGQKARCWRVAKGDLVVMRLRPEIAPPPTDYKGQDLRSKLSEQFQRRWSGAYEDGFAAGRAARQGKPELSAETGAAPDVAHSYPRLRRLD